MNGKQIMNQEILNPFGILTKPTNYGDSNATFSLNCQLGTTNIWKMYPFINDYISHENISAQEIH